MADREKDLSSLPRLHTGPMRVVGRGRESRDKPAWNAREWLREKTGRIGHGGNKGENRRTGNGRNEDGPKMNTITIQAIICGVVIVSVLVMKALNVPQTTEVLAGLDSALTTNSDMDKALGKLKFVGDFFADSSPVFSPEAQGFVPPIKDMAIETGGSEQYVINIDVADAVTPVLAAADGQVFYSGTSNDYGTLLIIRHQEGYETWYGGLTPEVKAGHTVLAGERIGKIQNSTLKFMAYRDGVALDPRPYLRKPGD